MAYSVYTMFAIIHLFLAIVFAGLGDWLFMALSFIGFALSALMLNNEGR